MNNKQLKKYMNNTEFFKLKDFDKTSSLHGDYKNDKFKEIIKLNQLDSTLDFENQFNYDGFNPYRYQPNIVNEDPSKSNIRSLATEINCIMKNDLQSHIEWICEDEIELNDSERRRFTIKFYLEYYEEINEAMTDILKEFTLNR